MSVARNREAVASAAASFLQLESEAFVRTLELSEVRPPLSRLPRPYLRDVRRPHLRRLRDHPPEPRGVSDAPHMLSIALRYAGAGISVFPVEGRSR